MGSTLAVTISGLLGNVAVVAGVAAAVGSAVLATVVLGQGRELRRLEDELDAETQRAYAAETALAAGIEAGALQRSQTAPTAASPVARTAAAGPVAAVVEDLGPEEPGGDAGPGFSGPEISSGSPSLGSATMAPVIAARIAIAEEEWEPDGDVGEGPDAPAEARQPGPGDTGRSAPIVIPSPVPEPAAASTALGEPATAAAGGIARAPRPPAQPLSGGSKRRNPWLVALVAVIVGGVVVVGVDRFAGGGSDNGENTGKSQPGTGSTGNSHAIVAVLNATPINGLAGQVSAQLRKAGFRKGPTATAGSQQVQKTVVAYLPSHAADAEAVAKTLGVESNPVAASNEVQAIACPDPNSCDVDVIVTVGADLTTR